MLLPQPSTRGFNYDQSEMLVRIRELTDYLNVMWKRICLARRYGGYMVFVPIHYRNDLHRRLLQR